MLYYVDDIRVTAVCNYCRNNPSFVPNDIVILGVHTDKFPGKRLMLVMHFRYCSTCLVFLKTI